MPTTWFSRADAIAGLTNGGLLWLIDDDSDQTPDASELATLDAKIDEVINSDILPVLRYWLLESTIAQIDRNDWLLAQGIPLLAQLLAFRVQQSTPEIERAASAARVNLGWARSGKDSNNAVFTIPGFEGRYANSIRAYPDQMGKPIVVNP